MIPVVTLGGVEYYTATNAGKVLSLSRQRVNILIKNGTLRAIRHGHHWLVTVESVEARQAASVR